MSWTDFFSVRMPHIYFVYGLAFFVLGLAVAMEVGRGEPTQFKQAMRPLALFGLLHGSYEWLEMFTIIGIAMYDFDSSPMFQVARLALLAASFSALIVFGLHMLRLPEWLPRSNLGICLLMLLFYGLGAILVGRWLNWQQPAWWTAADALARYSLAIPGSVMAAWALLVQRQALLRLSRPDFARDMLWAAISLLLYGLVGQLFVEASPLFPSNLLNAETFRQWFGIPVQLFRTGLGIILAIFIIRALRTFEYNRQQALAAARRQVEEEITRRDAQRQEFLRRIVKTQEDERSRIARELHDELGQTLTGLAMGLRGVQTPGDDPSRLMQQLSQLEDMAVQALANMRRLVNDLRPALLDDMGLRAALRQSTDNFARVTGIETSLTVGNHHARLPAELETILFRITQEALTNVARHSGATHAWVKLSCTDTEATLEVKDNGLGFDPISILKRMPRTGWGLMGIEERIGLVNGQIRIVSEPGGGVALQVKAPLQKLGETLHADRSDAG